MNPELLHLIKRLNLKTGREALEASSCPKDFAGNLVGPLLHFGTSLTYRKSNNDIFMIGHPINLPDYTRTLFKTRRDDGSLDPEEYAKLLSETEKLFLHIQKHAQKKHRKAKQKAMLDTIKRHTFFKMQNLVERQYINRLASAYAEFNRTSVNWEPESVGWKNFEDVRKKARSILKADTQLAWHRAVESSVKPDVTGLETLQRDAEIFSQFEMDAIEQLLLKKSAFHQMIDQRIQNNLGVISPFEFLQLGLLENISGQSVSDLIFMRNGIVNNDPKQTTELDGPMLHFYQGQIVLTQNQDELIQFYSQKAFLKNNILQVNPAWSMDKWEPVIKKQVQLGQVSKISVPTRTAFLLAQERKIEQGIPYEMTPEVYFLIKEHILSGHKIPTQVEKLYHMAHGRDLGASHPPAAPFTVQFDREKKTTKDKSPFLEPSPKKPTKPSQPPKPH